MRICVFGNYEEDYNRTEVILKGLAVQGVELVSLHSKKTTWRGLLRDLRDQFALLRNTTFDYIFVPHTNWRGLVLHARWLAPSTPLIVDMLYALGDNWILERRLAARYSWKTFYYYVLDFAVLHIATLVLVENHAHADYFAKHFFVSKKKFVRSLVGADPDKMSPKARDHGPERFIVEFHGTFFPMQGTDVIVRAAGLLQSRERIHFVMTGGGQKYSETKALAGELGLKNITFHPWASYEKITNLVAEADVTLGLIGDFPRVYRSTPNKLFESAAMGRLCINADTPAVREMFTEGRDVVLVKPGDPQALAEKISWLCDHPERRDQMEREVYQTFLRIGTPSVIGKTLLAELEKR